jgi:hypothetical protein
MMSDWKWIPNVSLGPIEFGGNIEKYLENIGAKYRSVPDDGTGWDEYEIPGIGIFIDVSENLVVSITSYKYFFYGIQNLIGIRVNQLESLLGQEADEIGMSVEYDNGVVQTPYEYRQFGLQIWSDEDDKIVSAVCYDCESDID